MREIRWCAAAAAGVAVGGGQRGMTKGDTKEVILRRSEGEKNGERLSEREKTD